MVKGWKKITLLVIIALLVSGTAISAEKEKKGWMASKYASVKSKFKRKEKSEKKKTSQANNSLEKKKPGIWDRMKNSAKPKAGNGRSSASDLLKTATPLDGLAKKDIKKGMGFGLAVGAACIAKTGNIKKCAILTGLTLLIGRQVGIAVANKRREYANEAEFLESSITAAEAAYKNKKGLIAQLKQTNREYNKSIRGFESQFTNNNAHIDALKEKLKEIKTTMKTLESNIKLYKGSISYIEKQIETEKTVAYASDIEKKERARKVKKLNKNKAKLITQFNQLNGIKVDMESSKERLAALIKEGKSNA